MNTAILNRLVWKEVRTLRALWLSLVMAAAVLQFGLVWVFEQPEHRAMWLRGVALALPAVYGLACAAMAFAGESEEGTEQLLCRLAVPPTSLFLVKVSVCVVSTLGLFAVLGLLGVGFQRIAAAETSWLFAGYSEQQFATVAWTTGFLSWGLFFSLLFRRVLPCLLTTLAATTVTPILVAVVDQWTPLGHSGQVSALLTNVDWPLRVIVLPLFLLLASAVLVRRWDEDRWPRVLESCLTAWQRIGERRVSDEVASGLAEPTQTKSLRRRMAAACTLRFPDHWLAWWSPEAKRWLWLEWRQARRVAVLLLSVMLLCLLAMGLGPKFHRDHFGRWFFPFALTLVSFAFGVWSFHAEQRDRRFRFVAGQGASAWTLWSTKQIVWFTTALVSVLFLTVVAAWSFYDTTNWGASGRWYYATHWVWDFGPWRIEFETLLGSFSGLEQWLHIPNHIDQWKYRGFAELGSIAHAAVAVALFFAVGQFVSLLIPRGVTAIVVGSLLVLAAFVWLHGTMVLSIPAWITMGPVLVAMFGTTLIRTTDWLEERNAWRSWLKVVTTTILPMAVMLAASAWFRAFELPEVPASKLAALHRPAPSAAARETAQQWQRLAEQLNSPNFKSEEHSLLSVPWDEFTDRHWIEANAEFIQQAHELASREDCAAFDLSSVVLRPDRLAGLLRLSILDSLERGQLQEAWQRGTTLYRLGEHLRTNSGFLGYHLSAPFQDTAFEELQAWARHPQQTAESIRATLRCPDAGPLSIDKVGMKSIHENMLHGMLAADYATISSRLTTAWREETWPWSWMPWERTRERRLLDHEALAALERARAKLNNLYTIAQPVLRLPFYPERSSTWLDSVQFTSRNRVWWPDSHAVERLIRDSICRSEAKRRALLLTLALQVYELDHGRLPQRLDELVGSYLEELPVDPWTGRSFEYRPEGLPVPVQFANRRIDANTPMLWTNGSAILGIVPRSSRVSDHVTPTQATSDDRSSADVHWRRVFASGPSDPAEMPNEQHRSEFQSYLGFSLTPHGTVQRR